MPKNRNRVRKPHPGGPKTPAGKARSAQNSIRHGLTAKAVVLKTEDPEKFAELLNDYILQFHPRTQVELDLVHELAACRWRIQRSWGLETNLIHIAIYRKIDDMDREFPEPHLTNNMRTALAFTEITENGKTFSLLQRYETRLVRRFHVVLQELKALQSQPFAEDCETNSESAPPPPLFVLPPPPKPDPEPDDPRPRDPEGLDDPGYHPPRQT